VKTAREEEAIPRRQGAHRSAWSRVNAEATEDSASTDVGVLSVTLPSSKTMSL
jgi:hypothetical protein